MNILRLFHLKRWKLNYLYRIFIRSSTRSLSHFTDKVLTMIVNNPLTQTKTYPSASNKLYNNQVLKRKIPSQVKIYKFPSRTLLQKEYKFNSHNNSATIVSYNLQFFCLERMLKLGEISILFLLNSNSNNICNNRSKNNNNCLIKRKINKKLRI